MKTKRPAAALFLEVDVRDSCWNWLGYKNEKGYGRVSHRGRLTLAHRVAYTVSRGKIPKGLLVCHTCDNPACVNPNHLFLGTNKDNNWDHWRKARPNKIVKLSPGSVREIRKLLQAGVKCGRIAEAYRVSVETIYGVRCGKTWAHVK